MCFCPSEFAEHIQRRTVWNCTFIEFQIVHLSLLYLHAATTFPPPTFNPRMVGNHTKKRVQDCSFPPARRGPVFVFAEREKGADAARPEFTLQSASAKKASCQLPAEGKTTGRRLRWFGEKDESGSLSISTACHRCSEPQGLRGGGGGGGFGFREGEKKQQAQNQAEKQIQTSLVGMVL